MKPCKTCGKESSQDYCVKCIDFFCVTASMGSGVCIETLALPSDSNNATPSSEIKIRHNFEEENDGKNLSKL